MENPGTDAVRAGHLRVTEPSPWVVRFAPLVRAGGPVLDLACGGGRNGLHLLARGHRVTFVDREVAAVRERAAGGGEAEILEIDLEDGRPFPFAGGRFAGIVVVNYLYRPHLGALIDALEPKGVLIYETFARGHERFARPRNPDHLLRAGELLEAVRGRLHVVAYEHGVVDNVPIPGVKARLCAVDAPPAPDRDDGEPEARVLYPVFR